MNSDVKTYLALVVYPATTILAFNWWSEASRWAGKNRSFYPPADLLRAAEKEGRFGFFWKYTIVWLSFGLLFGGRTWQVIGLRPSLHVFVLLAAAGIVGGVLAFVCRRILVVAIDAVAATEPEDSLRHGPFSLWIAIFVAGALTEEFWRALCISAFLQGGYGYAYALLLPAFAFAIAHLAGLPPRIPGGLENLLPEMGIGIIFSLLIISLGSVSPAIAASFVYYTLNMFWLRRSYPMALRAD